MTPLFYFPNLTKRQISTYIVTRESADGAHSQNSFQTRTCCGMEKNMTRDSYKYECSAEIGSVTEAMKAQKVLAAAAIPSEIIKKEGSSRRRGCVFGIGFSCAQQNNVRAVLGSARIYPKAFDSGHDIS